MSHTRSRQAMYAVAAVLVTAVVLVSVVGVAAAAGNEITDLSSPTAAAEGDYPQVEAEAEMEHEADITAELQVYMYNPETDETETICSDSADLSESGTKTLSCSGEFTMPGNDVEVQARLLFRTGQVLDDESQTVELVENPGDGGGDEGGDDDDGDDGDDSGSGGEDGGDDGDSEDEDNDEGWFAGLKNSVKNALTAVFVEPFRALGRALLDIYTHVIETFPQVDDNPAIEEVHNLTLAVALTLGSASLMIVGLLFMTGPMFGISYQQVKMVLPRIVVAMAFGTVSLPLLQMGIDFFDVLTQVFKPENPSFHSVLNFSIGLIIVAVVQAAVLLAVLLMHVMIDVYVVFIAAISPLIALCWALPKTKQYADKFIASWWAALAVPPLSMLVIRTSLSLLDTYPGELPSPILGIGMLLMLLLIPKMLLQMSMMMLGVGYTAARTATEAAKEHAGTVNDRYENLQKRQMLRTAKWRRQKKQTNKAGDEAGKSLAELRNDSKFDVSERSRPGVNESGGDSQ